MSVVAHYAEPIQTLNPQYQDKEENTTVFFGVSNVKELAAPCDALSQTQLNFHTTLDSPFDACVFVDYYVQVVLKVNDAAANTFMPKLSDFCLAPYPLQRSCDNLMIDMNNGTSSVKPKDFINALAWYSSDDLSLMAGSSCPTAPDICNNHFRQGRQAHDSVAIRADSPFCRTSGVSKNRALFNPTSSALSTSTGGTANNTITLKYHVVEPLISSPFLTDPLSRQVHANIGAFRAKMSFTNLKTMVSTGGFTYNNGADRFLPIQDANVTVTLLEQPYKPQLIFRTYTTSLTIPRFTFSPYREIDTSTYAVPSTALGASSNFNTNRINLEYVPNEMYIYVRRKNGPSSSSHADAYGAITKLTIDIPGHNSCLTNATQEQLFNMCKRNGLDMNCDGFSEDIGSVIKISMDKLDLGEYVGGTLIAFPITIKGTFTNTTSNIFGATGLTRDNTADVDLDPYFPVAATEWELMVVTVLHGRLKCGSNMLDKVYGVSNDAVMRATDNKVTDAVTDPTGPSNPVDITSLDNLHGQGFWRDFRKGFRHGFKGVTGVASAVAPLAGLAVGKPAIGMGVGQAANALSRLAGNSYIKG